jgi:predicted nucleic acid-binding protein
MMKALIDTNVIIDYLDGRAPYADHAEKLFILCEQEKLTGILTASSATDIYYIMRKITGRAKALESLKLLLSVFEVADVSKHDLLRAMELPITDFEDALMAVCAKRVKATCIVTRNIRDFANSPVPPLLPEDFLAQYSPGAAE